MARAHCYKVLQDKTTLALLTGATVQLYEANGTTPLVANAYTGDTGATTLTKPFVTATGIVEFYLDVPQRVVIGVTPSGSGTETKETVDLVPVGGSTPPPAAPAVSYDPTGRVHIAAGSTDVAAALADLDGAVATGGGGGGAASGVTFDPTGLIIVNGTDVQSALHQLDTFSATRRSFMSIQAADAAGIASSTAPAQNGSTLQLANLPVGNYWVDALLALTTPSGADFKIAWAAMTGGSGIWMVQGAYQAANNANTATSATAFTVQSYTSWAGTLSVGGLTGSFARIQGTLSLTQVATLTLLYSQRVTNVGTTKLLAGSALRAVMG